MAASRSRFLWLSRRTLRQRIGAAMALVVVLVSILLGGLVSWSSEIEARARIGQSLALDAQRLAERLNIEMATRARELNLLAGIDALRELPDTVEQAPGIGVAPALTQSLARTQALLDDLKGSVPAYTWIAVADARGRVLAATDPASLGTDISTRGGRHAGLRGPGVGALPQPVDDTRVMDLVQPIRNANGDVVGLIAAQLSWKWVRGIERSLITSDSDGVIRRESFLVSNQDAVLLGPVGTIGLAVNQDAVSRARAGFYGWTVERWQGFQDASAGGDFLTGISFAGGVGPAPAPGSQEMRWAVLVREAVDIAFAPATMLRHEIWLAGLWVALCFAGIGWLLAGMATAPLARIAAAAERLRQGDDVELPMLRGAVEIETLSRSLRALVATLTRKQLALEEMEGLALRDPLTGVLNRNGMRLRLEQALAKAQVDGSSLMVFVGDLDGFKQVNDTLGHAAGDLLLCQVAARLVRAVRAEDIVARTGGDEFILALAAPGGVADDQALGVVRRAQAAVTAPYELHGRLVRVGCSLGGASWPEHLAGLDVAELGEGLTPAEGFELVMQRADAALYTVKRGGKGRILLHGDLDETVAASQIKGPG